jgi:hypothetical protein
MGDKNIRKEVKKKKKADANTSSPSAALKSVVVQPELVKKKEKGK